MTQDLINGAAEFKQYHYDGDEDLMSELYKVGQDPDYFIISCIDSRCNPGTIFRAKPGIFFSHKAMGAIVRPYQQGTALAAALQFAINYNNIKTIIVFGHTQCGAIKALAGELDDAEISGFVNVAQNALNRAKKFCSNHQDILDKTEQEAILESVENLKGYPSIAKALEKNNVEIKSWQFDMRTGDLKEYNESAKTFDVIGVNETLSDKRHKG